MTDFYPPEEEMEPALKDGLSAWDDLRRIADELELKLHLASMDARDRWRAIEPRLAMIEERLARTGKRVTKAIMEEVADVRAAIERLRDDVAKGN